MEKGFRDSVGEGGKERKESERNRKRDTENGVGFSICRIHLLLQGYPPNPSQIIYQLGT